MVTYFKSALLDKLAMARWQTSVQFSKLNEIYGSIGLLNSLGKVGVLNPSRI